MNWITFAADLFLWSACVLGVTAIILDQLNWNEDGDDE